MSLFPGAVTWEDGVHRYMLGTGFVAAWEVGRRCRFFSVSEAKAALRTGWRRADIRQAMLALPSLGGRSIAVVQDDEAALGELARRLLQQELWLFDMVTPPEAAPPGPPPVAPPVTKSAAGGSWDIDAAVKQLMVSAKPKSTARCAAHVRQAIEAGSLALSRPNPVSAKDYGPYLRKHGFAEIAAKEHAALKGDIVVIQNHKDGNINGHIAMFSGKAWISDFVQSDFWGGPGYRKHQPAHAFFRWPVKGQR